MFDLYTAIVFFTIFTILINLTDVAANRLLSKKHKWQIAMVCILTGIAVLCEWTGVKTNGQSVEFIGLHRAAKLVEFCVAPCIAFSAAIAYGRVDHMKAAKVLLTAHVVFEIVAVIFNLVFSIDSQNIYHRECLYGIYVAAFCLTTAYAFVCMVRGSKKSQARFGSTIMLTICFLAAGIFTQILNSEIRIDYTCVAITNLFLYNNMLNVSNQIDSTTLLLNRRCYEKYIENVKSPAYVLIFDINKFKNINDTYGHAEGDRCLKTIAGIIFKVYGKQGFCYRIGGDEFCVIMKRNLSNIEQLNSEFNAAIDASCENNAKMTNVSVGYAYYDERITDIQAVIEKADEMMYKNKR